MTSAAQENREHRRRVKDKAEMKELANNLTTAIYVRFGATVDISGKIGGTLVDSKAILIPKAQAEHLLSILQRG